MSPSTRRSCRNPNAGLWWEPSLSGRRKMHLTIAHRVYQLTSSAVALPGEDERLYVLALLPAAEAAAADQSSTAHTALLKRP
jgi:hypothetical protein